VGKVGYCTGGRGEGGRGSLREEKKSCRGLSLEGQGEREMLTPHGWARQRGGKPKVGQWGSRDCVWKD